MKQTVSIAIVALCVICAATMMGGCLGTYDVSDTIPAQGSTPPPELQSREEYINNVPSEYDRAKFDQSDIRGSDGFVLKYTVNPRGSIGGSIKDEEWKVYSIGTYPEIVDYREDHHKFVVIVDHYATNNAALAVMTEEMERYFPAGIAYDGVTSLHYEDQSYKFVSGDFTKVDEDDTIRGHSTRIVVFKDRTIGRMYVDGYYGDVNECTEVADYYVPFLSAMLDDIDAEGVVYPSYHEFSEDNVPIPPLDMTFDLDGVGTIHVALNDDGSAVVSTTIDGRTDRENGEWRVTNAGSSSRTFVTRGLDDDYTLYTWYSGQVVGVRDSGTRRDGIWENR